MKVSRLCVHGMCAIGNIELVLLALGFQHGQLGALCGYGVGF